jgi:hypothetical protein
MLPSLAQRLKRAVVVGLATSLTLLAAVRCGNESKKKKPETTTAVSGLPSDWDGKADWTGSALEVNEE